MERGQVRFILDAKWKRLDPRARNHGVSQADAYQLFAYGRRYGCRRVVLVYPRTTAFSESLNFRFVGDRRSGDGVFPVRRVQCGGERAGDDGGGGALRVGHLSMATIVTFSMAIDKNDAADAEAISGSGPASDHAHRGDQDRSAAGAGDALSHA